MFQGCFFVVGRIVTVNERLQVVTSKQLSARETIAAVPESLWITLETVRKSSIGPYVR